jgi:hypothetical protein
MQCHYRLMFDAKGLPMMYVYDSCAAFLRTVPLMMYDEHKPEDLDTDLEDHVCDEWRYMCMARPITPKLRDQPQIVGADPLGQMEGRKNVRRLPGWFG